MKRDRTKSPAEGWLDHAVWLAGRADQALEQARRAEIRANGDALATDPNDVSADAARGDRSLYA